MKKIKQQLMISRNDYEVIMAWIKRRLGKVTFNKEDAKELETEIKKATLVDKEKLPPDVVRLNSTVIIKEEKQKKEIQVTVVTPEKADIRQRKISIMSPIGTALIGFRKGHKISWQVPSGKKVFTILDVANNF